ncbi:MAG: amidohydrolase family protein [Burkholderiales bacterium]
MAKKKPFIIALEEHYTDPAVMTQAKTAGTPVIGSTMYARLAPMLNDLGDLRLKHMDEAGIDVQVISHGPSSIQQLDAATCIRLATDTNNLLHSAIQKHPTRFAGFAALPTPDPKAAADELERCVAKLGFKGAMIHGRTQGKYHDDARFHPIFERAQSLDVPIYIHPGQPHEAVAAAYYDDYLKDFPALANAAWGYTIDTASQILRMILSGLFDKYPKLKIIVGHQGEGMPFLVDRVDEAVNRGGKQVAFKEIFCNNFWITTSGHFSTPALTCSLMEMGVERVLFSVDYPFVENVPGTKWMEGVPLSDEDKEKIFNGNAKKLLKM